MMCTSAAWIFFVLSVICASPHHAVTRFKVLNHDGDLKIDPAEGIVHAGDNISFTCTHPSNVSFHWNLPIRTRSFETTKGIMLSETAESVYFSKITLPSVKRIMSGEINCQTGDGSSAIAFLIVNGMKNGGACSLATDCVTDRAICRQGLCECPQDHVLLQITENGYEVCRRMIYNLYDPCEFNEQCTHLVDPKSVCAISVCVCSAWTTDVKGVCVTKSEIRYNRSQEMYRVGLIAVTCIIILVVAVSLWITLKKSCRDRSSTQRRRSSTRNNSNGLPVDISSDKPPSYDDILVAEDTYSSPPNIKDALKHCITAKKLLRQASAPAGQLTSGPLNLNGSKDWLH